MISSGAIASLVCLFPSSGLDRDGGKDDGDDDGDAGLELSALSAGGIALPVSVSDFVSALVSLLSVSFTAVAAVSDGPWR